MDLASKLFKGDRVIWVIFMFLCLVSVIEVFSATSTIAYKNANHWAPIVRHATFLLGGFVLVISQCIIDAFSLFINSSARFNIFGNALISPRVQSAQWTEPEHWNTDAWKKAS